MSDRSAASSRTSSRRKASSPIVLPHKVYSTDTVGDAASSSDDESSSADLQLTSYNVVVVESRDVFRSKIVELLQETGFEHIESFADGQEVLKRASTNHERFDLLFINVALTDGSGVEFVKNIEEQWHRTLEAVVYMSVSQSHVSEIPENSPLLLLPTNFQIVTLCVQEVIKYIVIPSSLADMLESQAELSDDRAALLSIGARIPKTHKSLKHGGTSPLRASLSNTSPRDISRRTSRAHTPINDVKHTSSERRVSRTKSALSESPRHSPRRTSVAGIAKKLSERGNAKLDPPGSRRQTDQGPAVMTGIEFSDDDTTLNASNIDLQNDYDMLPALSTSSMSNLNLLGQRDRRRSTMGQANVANAALTAVANTLKEVLVHELDPKVQQQLQQLMNGVEATMYTAQDRRLKSSSIIEKARDDVTKDWLLSEYTSIGDRYNRRASTVATFPSKKVEDIIATKKLKSWSFDPFQETEKTLMASLPVMFETFQLFKTFKIDRQRFEAFVIDVRSRYQDNPYHNFRHACDVTQTCYSFLTQFNASAYLTHIDILGLLLAALTHDLGHPGLNNAFHVRTDHELALRYNDRSVLENYHSCLAFTLMRKEENNFLPSITDDEKRTLREIITTCILGTDVAEHFEFLEDWRQVIDERADTFPDRNNDRDRLMVAQIILKAADMSNVTKPWRVAKKWCERVSSEFFQQGDLERSRNLTPAPHMDRTKITAGKVTINFIDYVAGSLFAAVVKLLPDAEQLVSFMASNRRHLLKLDAKQAAAMGIQSVTEAAREKHAAEAAEAAAAAKAAKQTEANRDSPSSASTDDDHEQPRRKRRDKKKMRHRHTGDVPPARPQASDDSYASETKMTSPRSRRTLVASGTANENTGSGRRSRRFGDTMDESSLSSGPGQRSSWNVDAVATTNTLRHSGKRRHKKERRRARTRTTEDPKKVTAAAKSPMRITVGDVASGRFDTSPADEQQPAVSTQRRGSKNLDPGSEVILKVARSATSRAKSKNAHKIAKARTGGFGFLTRRK